MKPFARVPRLGFCLPPLSSGDPMEPVDPRPVKSRYEYRWRGRMAIRPGGIEPRCQSVNIARQSGYGWITGPSGGAWAAGISPARALSLPESLVTVTPNGVKAAAGAAAESSALMRIHRPG